MTNSENFKRIVDVYVKDRSDHPVVDAEISFTLNGTHAGKVPNAAGHASIRLPNRTDVLGVTAKFRSEEQTVTLAQNADHFIFRFDGPPPPPPAAPPHIRAGTPVLLVTLIFSGIFGFLSIYGGIQLMAATGSGETAFDFVGLHFTTKQAGVASIGLGAIVIILTFRRVLKSLEILGKL